MKIEYIKQLNREKSKMERIAEKYDLTLEIKEVDLLDGPRRFSARYKGIDFGPVFAETEELARNLFSLRVTANSREVVAIVEASQSKPGQWSGREWVERLEAVNAKAAEIIDAIKEEAANINHRLQALKAMGKMYRQKGSDQEEYTIGYVNGVECAIACMEGASPQCVDAPHPDVRRYQGILRAGPPLA